MKVNYNWLKDFVDIRVDPEQLGELLTMAGLEVDSIEPVGESLDRITAARIMRVRPHPGADRLKLCDVDTGEETLQVVCGAPNLEEEMVAPFAAHGVRIPNGLEIRKSTIRGEKSYGMLLAEDELGLTDDHEGLMLLDDDVPPGTPLSSVLPFPDWVFEVSVTPNRPDWTSVEGIAREIAAVTGSKLRLRDFDIEGNGPPISSLVDVTIEDSEGCPRYCAGLVQGVQLAPSPFWLRYRLHACGLRAINNVVDATNYVLLETGQPLHSFDYKRVSENRIIVRRAEEGERFTTLDGDTRTLSSEILMICDGARPVAIAGIMGGLNSEIFAGTTDVLLESAYFDPVTIRRGSRRLGLSTEASYRFERGVDPEGTPIALKRCLSLIVSLAGGKVADGFIDARPRSFTRPRIELRVERTNRILGTDLDIDTVGKHLSSLQMQVEERGENLTVTPPSFRMDIDREIDLVEEVARIEGYKNIPVTFPAVRPCSKPASLEYSLRDKIREILVGSGFSEVISYSFTSRDSVGLLDVPEEHLLRNFVSLMNPLSIDQSVMRTSLIPGVAGAARTNISRGEQDLKLFEWGKIFTPSDDDLPLETTMVSGLMTGLYHRKEWYGNEKPVDFYHVKGVVETLLDGIHVDNAVFTEGHDSPGYDKEGPVACISAGDQVLGVVGKASRAVTEFCRSKDGGEVYLFELYAAPLLQWWGRPPLFKPYPKFPAVYRDLSVIVDPDVKCAAIECVIREKGGELVEDVSLFDIYDREGDSGLERAIAFRICYRSPGSTLDGATVNALHESIIEAICAETGGRLREG
ncbi:MAG: phenylalanine--tRNA ligase subunit beta [Desulfatiglandaceae bacterium]